MEAIVIKEMSFSPDISIIFVNTGPPSKYSGEYILPTDQTWAS